MKILWFSNHQFSEQQIKSTGTWLKSLGEELSKTKDVDLFNITHGKVNQITHVDSKTIKQWIVPQSSLLPRAKIIKDIQIIVDEIKPDIIHIWGLESYWGLLTSRGYLSGNVILEIQGIKFTIEKHFYSGLTFYDIIKCIGIKELIRPFGSILGQKYTFKRWGKFEKEMLITHKHISTQSDWVRSHVQHLNASATIYKTSIALRSEFINANKWDFNNCIPCQIFTSFSSIVSYKGLHILIDAISILKKTNPNIKLVIAGNVSKGFREDGYTKWIKSKIKKLELIDNIYWVGSLDANEIVWQIQKANVIVIPSFVESYCLVLDEALTIGAPIVASYAGAMPELAIHDKTALLFPPGDIEICASYINKFLDDKLYSEQISANAYSNSRLKKITDVAAIQLSIYHEVLNN
jgi:glycosyltransferase involved in cell wall biosynthesis